MTARAIQGARGVRVPWHAVALGLVLALSGGNLLFASFDPGGLVAVDKTPLRSGCRRRARGCSATPAWPCWFRRR